MTLDILRVGHSEDATYGVFRDNGVPFAVTLELPWIDNITNKSCIPSGSYTCKRIVSAKFGDVFEICNVPNRSHVLIHKGNYTRDIQGCIIVAEKFSHIDKDGIMDVGESTEGFNEFMDKLKGEDEFTLNIKEL